MDCRTDKKLDYYITAAETPKEILRQFTQAVGRSPLMPSYVLGLWQSKLRYRNQEEVLAVAREYKKRQVPVDVIVIDFSIGLNRENFDLIRRTGRIRKQW